MNSHVKRSTNEWNAAETEFEGEGVGSSAGDDRGARFLQLHVIAEADGIVGVRLLDPLNQAGRIFPVPSFGEGEEDGRRERRTGGGRGREEGEEE